MFLLLMYRTNIILLFVLLFGLNCKSDKDQTIPETDNELINSDITGSYEGYKTFNKSQTDSVAVSLKVEKNSELKYTITELRPFVHYFGIDVTGLNFTYDRGSGEDDCGATRLTGNGYFKERSLYIIETTKCVKANFPDEHVEYRVSKK